VGDLSAVLYRFHVAVKYTIFISYAYPEHYLLTNIPVSPAQNITTETVFTDHNKTNILSNPVKTTPQMADAIKSSEITTLTD